LAHILVVFSFLHYSFAFLVACGRLDYTVSSIVSDRIVLAKTAADPGTNASCCVPLNW